MKYDDLILTKINKKVQTVANVFEIMSKSIVYCNFIIFTFNFIIPRILTVSTYFAYGLSNGIDIIIYIN